MFRIAFFSQGKYVIKTDALEADKVKGDFKKSQQINCMQNMHIQLSVDLKTLILSVPCFTSAL